MLLTKRESDEPIITDTADTDWYTYTQCFALMVEQPYVAGTLVLIDRDNRQYPPGFNEKFRRQINLLAKASLSPEAEAHMRKTAGHYLPKWFFDYCNAFRYNPDMVYSHQEGGHFQVSVHGLAYEIVRYEPAILAIISQLLNEAEGTMPDPNFQEIVRKKAQRLAVLGADFSDMMTRRRPYKDFHRMALHEIRAGAGGHLKGTSNAALAAELGITLIGTMGHFYPQVQSGQYGVRSANRMAMTHWDNAFHGILGTMITDTFTTSAFLKDLTPHFANLFRGTREDSGSSLHHIDWMVEHYQKLGIDPMTKEVTFTNSLDDIKIESIKRYVEGKLRDYYGLGGWWYKDLGMITPNIVMKLWDVTRPEEPDRKIWVVKIPNEIGKRSGAPEAISAALFELGISE